MLHQDDPTLSTSYLVPPGEDEGENDSTFEVPDRRHFHAMTKELRRAVFLLALLSFFTACLLCATITWCVFVNQKSTQLSVVMDHGDELLRDGIGMLKVVNEGKVVENFTSTALDFFTNRYSVITDLLDNVSNTLTAWAATNSSDALTSLVQNAQAIIKDMQSFNSLIQEAVVARTRAAGNS